MRTVAVPPLVGVLVATVLAPVLVLAAAGPAAALASAPAKPTLPSSVIGSLDTATPAERARMVANTLPSTTLPSGEAAMPPVPLTSPAAQFAGKAVGVAGAAFTGWQIGSGIASLFGLDSDSALRQLVGLQPAEGYVVNGDAPASGGFLAGTAPMRASSGRVTGSYTVRDDGLRLALTADGYALTGPVTVTLNRTSTDDDTVAAVLGLRCSGGGWQSQELARIRDYAPEQSVTATAQVDLTCSSASAAAPDVLVQAPFFLADPQPDWITPSQIEWVSPDSGRRAVDNPTRRWSTRAQCSDGSTVEASSEDFTEGDAQYPVPAPATCPAGTIPNSVDVWEVTPGRPELDKRVDGFTSTDAARDWASTYPECATAACTLDLLRIDGTQPRSCFDAPSACLDWWSLAEPMRSQTYRCEYAGRAVDITECAVLAPTFNVATGSDVLTDTGRVPAGDVSRYADPRTGKPVPRPSTETPYDPSPSTDPDTGGSTSPDPGTSTGTDPGTEPDSDPDCRSTLIIFGGVLCALQDAFVPSTATLAQVTALGTSLGTITPVPQLKSFVTWVSPPADLKSRCLNLDMHMPEGGPWPTTIPAVHSCESGPVMDAVHDLRPLLVVVVWVTTFSPLAWWAWRTYAPGSTGTA